MDKYETNVTINSKKRLQNDTGAVCTTNPVRWRLGSRLRMGATSLLLRFRRGHPSHFYQLCIHHSTRLDELNTTVIQPLS